VEVAAANITVEAAAPVDLELELHSPSRQDLNTQ
jgi:hypothetical protein